MRYEVCRKCIDINLEMTVFGDREKANSFWREKYMGSSGQLSRSRLPRAHLLIPTVNNVCRLIFHVAR